MKLIYKLTPWILLAAIIAVLVISYFMNKSSYHVEGFESRIKLENYYDNKIELTKLHDNIHFDEINGSLVFVNDSGIDVLNRDGTTTMPEKHNDSMENLVDTRKFTHHIVDEVTNENKYTIFYSAIGKHTNIYIFGYTNITNDDTGDIIQHVTLIGSYAFTIDNGNCTPEGSGSGTCNAKNDTCSSGVGYYDKTSETHKCCSCTPEFAGKDITFTGEEGKIEGLTPIEQSAKSIGTSGIATITKYDTVTALERIITDAVLFDKKMGNLVLIDSHENDGSATTPTIINHKNENMKNTNELEKAENLTSLFTIHKNMLILYSLYSDNVNLTVIQLVNQSEAEASPKLELISSNHYIIDTPSASATSSLSTSSSSASDISSNSSQSMSNDIFNRVSSKIGDVIEHELDKLLDPNANHDDNYILKTQIVPPVCPTCPNCESNCRGGGVCTDCGGQGGSGTRSESGSTLAKEESKKGPVSKVIDEAGNVVEQTVDATGNLVSTTVGAAGNLIKDTAGTAVDVLDDTVGDVARDVYGGARGVASDVYGTTKNVAGEVYGTTKGLAGDAYSTTKGLAGDIYGTTSGILGDLYGGAKQLTQDVYGGVKNVGSIANASMQGNMQRAQQQQLQQGGLPVQGNGANIGVTQRTAYTNTGISQPNVYNYYGALPEKQLNFIPITTDFSAFGR